MLTVKDLHKSYQVGKTTYEVLKGVSLSVETGEFVAVMGPSGSGKTTLLNCISCYIPADSGQITLGTEELARLDEDALAAVRNRKLGEVLVILGLVLPDHTHHLFKYRLYFAKWQQLAGIYLDIADFQRGIPFSIYNSSVIYEKHQSLIDPC